MSGLQIENYCVWYEICSVRGEKYATVQRIRKKYTYEFDKINAQKYMKCSKNVPKKCLKVCGKAIHLPRLNDGRVRNREKKFCVFRVKIVLFGQFYANYFHKKQFNYAQIVLHCEWQQVQTDKMCNTRCLRDNANVIT